jgi:hypothetical protein
VVIVVAAAVVVVVEVGKEVLTTIGIGPIVLAAGKEALLTRDTGVVANVLLGKAIAPRTVVTGGMVTG